MVSYTNSTCDLYENPVDQAFIQSQLVLVAGTATISIVALKTFEFYKGFSWESIKTKALKIVTKLPIIRGLVDKELTKEKLKLAEEILSRKRPGPIFRYLPPEKLDHERIIEIFKMREDAVPHPTKTFKQSGIVYYDEKHLLEIQRIIGGLSLRGNSLHPGTMDHYLDMEAEVVSMVGNMFNGSDDVCGNMTSGGTASNFHAVWAYYNRANEKGITRPNLVIPTTAHASFDKAAEVMNIRLIKVPVDGNSQVILEKMKKAINGNTIAIVGSAGHFSHGVFDDIEALSDLALMKKVPLHVDCCMGSFMAPLARKAGHDIPLFDFELEGVTSISCDPHKYGFTPKGASVILYRNQELHQHQMFTYPKWDGGIYATPTLPGSRPGANIAMTWASMLSMGEIEYTKAFDEIIALRKDMQEFIASFDELQVIGNPKLAIVGFHSKPNTFNIYNLESKLKEKGWGFAALQNPNSLHFDFTLVHARHDGFRDMFMSDFKACIKELREDIDSDMGTSGTAKLYGTVQKVPKHIADILAKEYWSLTYKLPPKEEVSKS